MLWVGQLRGTSPDHLLLAATLACLGTFLLLISRLRAGRAYRRLRDERDDLKQQLATLQATYDSEVRWRKTCEGIGAPHPATEKGAAKPSVEDA